jgi:hypothetical protein
MIKVLPPLWSASLLGCRKLWTKPDFVIFYSKPLAPPAAGAYIPASR